MPDRNSIDEEMRSHYESVWIRGDAWELESCPYEQGRYARQLSILQGERSRRALEIGCGSGCFTRLLLEVADEITALDIAAAAIDRARAQIPPGAAVAVRFEVANIMEYDLTAHGPWDLVVLSETIYSLGWLYPMFDIAQVALAILQSMSEGGRLLLANTYGSEKDWLLQPSLINTYRDLFRNVGFNIDQECIFEGEKHGQRFRVLMSLFRAPT